MSEQELEKFIQKVANLNELVRSLDAFPQRRKRLAACDTHDQVIALAKSWGYEISRRWGESTEENKPQAF